MIANRTDDAAELLVFGDIGDEFMGGITAKMFQEELKSLGDVKNINVKINSGGGLAFDGVSMRNSLLSHPAHVTVEVMGLAASAASIVAMGGDTVLMRSGSMLMIHLPFGLVLGTAEDMRKQAGILDQLTEELIKIYRAKTNKRDHTLRAMLTAETWMSGEQAVEEGFADKVVNAPAVKASLDPSRFLNCPREWLEGQAESKPKIADPWRSRAARRAESLQL